MSSAIRNETIELGTADHRIRKFKHCAVDVSAIRFVNANSIMFRDGREVTTADDRFADIIEHFAEQTAD